MDRKYKLTGKELKFCELYMQYNNGARAVREAGYIDKSPRVRASKLLSKDNIKAYICDRITEQEKNLVADTNEVLRFKTRMMRGEIQEDQVTTVLVGVGMSEATIVKKQAPARERNAAAKDLLDLYTRVNLIDEDNPNEEAKVHRSTLAALKERPILNDDEENSDD